ncbi:MAG TPA: iron-containing alcohol dehydrogenase [Candidatus Micrarchaeaceae archaeon]|nr:iron-containing alcohol dehydrogenase [Candidatus Micrarchaeaceae archaeon]
MLEVGLRTLDQQFLLGPRAAGLRLAAASSERRWKSVAVITSPSVAAGGLIERVAHVGWEVVACASSVRPHAPVEDTEAIAASLRGLVLDAIVAVGGGSVIDTAKAVALLLAWDGGLEDHLTSFEPPDRYVQPTGPMVAIPIVAVPTTLAGAEVTGSAGVQTRDQRKRTVAHPSLAPRLVASDPEFLATTPRSVLITTGMCALAHCAEALCSIGANPMSTALALESTRLLFRGLPAAEHDTLGVAAVMAGLALASAPGGLEHALCHVVAARAGVSHGVAHSILLPAVMAYNRASTTAAQERFAEALGAGPTADAAAAVMYFRGQLDAPSRLRSVGFLREDLSRIAAEAMHERGTYWNPRHVSSANELVAVLEEAW